MAHHFLADTVSLLRNSATGDLLAQSPVQERCPMALVRFVVTSRTTFRQWDRAHLKPLSCLPALFVSFCFFTRIFHESTMPCLTPCFHDLERWFSRAVGTKTSDLPEFWLSKRSALKRSTWQRRFKDHRLQHSSNYFSSGCNATVPGFSASCRGTGCPSGVLTPRDSPLLFQQGTWCFL